MVKIQLITQINSLYNSVVLVIKKQNSTRLKVEFCLINIVLQFFIIQKLV